jgi:hypothetical protein
VTQQIFVSYSHEDKAWAERLEQALRPLARKDEIDVWSDRRIAAGEPWAERIDEQIERSNVALLLVSAAFLDSDFIADVELPRLVAGARAGRLTLLWVPVSASLWEVTELGQFQAVINPRTPLDSMSPARVAEAFVTIAKTVAGGRTLTDLGSAMQVIDAASTELNTGSGAHRVLARHTGSHIAFEERDASRAIATITVAELAQLPADEHRLIHALEEGMREEFERWTVLRPRRSTLTDRERLEYEAAGRRMCAELRNILDFIEQQLGKHLQDHYHGIRFACDRLVSGD